MSQTPVHGKAGAVAAAPAATAYRELIERLTLRIEQSRGRAARVLNTELVTLYWSIGHEILEAQRTSGWGDDVVGQIAQDLAADSGSARGFSRRNLFYMRRFAALWPDLEKVPPVVAQIGWSAHRVLLDSFGEEPALYLWYATQAAEQRWSRRHLKGQIDLRLHQRRGAAVNNFAEALAADDARHALAAIKDPYVFEFLDLADDAQERHLEQALIEDIQRFLLELGSGFAFYGRQHSLLVGGQEFFLDLLFYHHRLRRFVVIDLKIGAFESEYVSKMNLYLNAVDDQLRAGDDRESVGIILCTERNETVSRLTLRRVGAPIAVSTWRSDAPVHGLSAGEQSDDPSGLAQLDDVRTRLAERVTRRTPELLAVISPHSTSADSKLPDR